MPAVVYESTIPMADEGILGRVTSGAGLSSRLSASSLRSYLNVLTSAQVDSAIAAYAAPLSHTHNFSQITGLSASRLLGRGDSGGGVAQEITLGTGLSLSGTTLSAAVTTPGGSNTHVQYNDGGAFGGSANFTYNASSSQLAIRAAGGSDSPFLVRNSGGTLVCQIDPQGHVGVKNVTNFHGFSVVVNVGSANGDGILLHGSSDATDGEKRRLLMWQIGNSGSIVLYNSSGQVTEQIGGSGQLSESVFNEQGLAFNFRIESDNHTHCFMVDGANDYVLMGTSSTSYRTFSPASNGGMTMSGACPANTNQVAGNLVIAPTPSRGSGTPSSVIIQGTVAGTSGTSEQTLENLVTIGNRTTRVHALSTTVNGLEVHNGTNAIFSVRAESATSRATVGFGHISNYNGYVFALNLAGANGNGVVLADGSDLTVWTNFRALLGMYSNNGSLELFTNGGFFSPHVVLKSSGYVFNEQGAAINFRVEGDNKPNCLLVTGSADEVSVDGAFRLADATHVSVGTSTGTKIGTSTSQKLGFWDATPVVQQVLATGAGATVDDVISLLQTLGLCRQT